MKKYSLCVKCLKALSVVKHRTLADCRAPNCKQCDGKHHTLLCMTQTGEHQFSTSVREDPDKDKDFYERKDPYDENIEHVFATTSLSEGATA